MKDIIHVEYILILLICLFGCNSDPEQMSHGEFLATHSYSVGQNSLELYDEERRRPIKTEIWYPTKDTSNVNATIDYPFIIPPTSKDAEIASEKFPLILLSHGTGGNRISQMWMACELVGNGYVVASVNHFGNTHDNKIPENFVKIWDRPMDISYLLDYLVGSSAWKVSIDTNKIGMAGFSLGGYTGIALAGAITDYQLIGQYANSEQGKSEFNLPELGDIRHLITPELIQKGMTEYADLKDKRISAFVVMAPALGQAFKSEEQFRFVETPILIIGAENDERTPVQHNARHYHRLIQNSRYIELEGEVGHYVFMNEAKSGLKRSAPIVFKDKKSVDRSYIHRKVSTVVIDFFDSQLKEKSH